MPCRPTRVTVGLRGPDRLWMAVSLSVHPGEVVGVIGPNGAGKTTLFNVVCGFVRAQHGDLASTASRCDGTTPMIWPSSGSPGPSRASDSWAGSDVLENVMARRAIDRPGPTSPRPTFGLWRSSREESRLRGRATTLWRSCTSREYAPAIPGRLPYAIQKRTALARALMPTRRSSSSTSRRAACRRTRWTSSATCSASGDGWACSWSSTTWTSSCRSATAWSCSTSAR